jgi:PhnB protein
MSKVNPIPEGYHSVTPYLCLSDASAALDFYQKAFGATELFRFNGPDGKIAHAEMKIGNSILMLSGEYPEMGFRSPLTLGGSPIGLMIYVEDVDTFAEKALAAGATLDKPIENKFYGDRSGTLKDPFGYSWHVSTHVEDVSPEELEKRMSQIPECGGAQTGELSATN